MSDNKRITHPQDAQRIDINDPNEVRNWTSALGSTEAQLKQAVGLRMRHNAGANPSSTCGHLLQ